jgi:regulator of cell morphogenesis and NO signaling
VSQTISRGRFAGRSLVEIAATLSGATGVFRRRRLDFCCGGKVSLAEAAAANNLPLDEIEAELGAIAALRIPVPISVMLAEHDDHREHLRELERITSQFTVPDDDCPSWRGLYAGAREFADDLVEHIHAENNLLFPRFGG